MFCMNLEGRTLAVVKGEPGELRCGCMTLGDNYPHLKSATFGSFPAKWNMIKNYL